MWDFEHPTDANRHILNDFEINYTVPSQCAQALQDGTADIGIIPSIGFATIPGLAILPDVAIASKNAVRSILLVLNKPVDQVCTVGLDTSSRTSVALTKILLARFFPGPERQYRSMPPKLEAMLAECDAALLIGDSALQVDRTKYHALDLAEEWRRLTGKPFVFAFWAVRMEALGHASSAYDLGEIFSHSRDHGLEPQNIEAIAREWSERICLSEADVRRYLQENIHYFLDPDNCEGLDLFYRYASELKLVPEAPTLRLLGNLAFRLYR